MPVPNDGQLVAAAWEDYVKTDPADQIFQSFWLLDNLKSGNSFMKGAGDPITGSIEYQINTTVKSMSELETLDTTRVDVFDRYEYAWKHSGGDIVISEFEKGATAGAAGKFDLEAKKIDNLNNSMKKSINDQLFSDGTGNSSKDAGGLQHIVSTTPTTGTVGAINRATYTFWRNQQASGALAATAFDNLKGAMRSIYNLCSSGVGMQLPSFAVGTRTVVEGYESLLVAQERYDRAATGDTGVSGFTGPKLQFKDIPVAWDYAAPTGNMYILNNRNLFIRWMYWMKAFPPVNPSNQFANVVKVLTTFNLCSDNPRRLGVVSGIT